MKSKYVDVHTNEIVKDLVSVTKALSEKMEEMGEEFNKKVNELMKQAQENLKRLKEIEKESEQKEEANETLYSRHKKNIQENKFSVLEEAIEGTYIYLYGDEEGIKKVTKSLSAKGIKGFVKNGDNQVAIPAYALDNISKTDFNKLLKSYEDREWIYGCKVNDDTIYIEELEV